MKKGYLILGLLFCFTYGYSQISIMNSITYEYDANGNRIKRRPTLSLIPQPGGGGVISQSDISLRDIKVYPNPTHGELIVEITPFDPEEDQGKIIIADEQGRLIYQTNLMSSSVYIDLTAHKEGLYFLYLECNEEKYSWKVIKE